MKNTKIKAHTWIHDSIIGFGSTIGKWVRIEGLSVLADDVQVKDELFINGAFVLPHKGLTGNIHEKGTIIM